MDQSLCRKILNRWVFRASVLGFLCAIFVSEWAPPFQTWSLFVCIGIVGTSLLLSRKMSTVISVFCLAFGIGAFIDIGHNEAIYQRQVTMHRYIALSTRNTTIEGTLSRSMGQSELGCRYALTDIRVDSGSVLSDKMGILLDIPCNQKLILQDRVSLRGKLEEIPVLKGFDYRSYLLLSGIYAQVRSDMLVVIRHGGASFATFIATIRQTFLEAIERVFPWESALLLEWLLIGERVWFSRETKKDMNASGLTHIVAVSGSNIVVFMAFIACILRFAPSRIRFFLVVVTLFGYLSIVWDQVPAQRAGIMGIVTYAAVLSARRIHTVHLLLLVSVLFVLVDPKILLFDVSFHLSFLSVLGIIFVSPYLKKALAFMPNILYIRESLIMTLAAMSFTAPLTWMTFGQFSVVAPLSNLIATPLISPALFFGFFATMVEFISHTIAVWVGFVGWLFLAGILWTIHFFGSFPFAVILLENEPSRFWGPGIYFTMLSLIFLAIELRGRQRTQG